MENQLNILVADDHSLIRKGVRLMLEDQTEFVPKITEASTGSEVLSFINEHTFDIILLDISLPDENGIEILKKIRTISPATPVLIQSMHKEKNIISQAIKYGTAGYILKNAENDELVHAITSILKKKNYYSNEVYQILNPIKSTNQFTAPLSDSDSTKTLTPRETEILVMISKEFTSQVIADFLFISKRTVDWHRKEIMKKLGIKTTVGLIVYALKNQIE